MSFPFEWLTKKNRLNAIYNTLISNTEILMALNDQVATLAARVADLEAAATNLAAKVDAEQAQVEAALALLTADNPALADAIVKLESVSANLAGITADVESTIPDAPPAEPPVA